MVASNYRPYRAPEPDPTPEEIAKRAAEIRATWDKELFAKRAGLADQGWAVPVASLPPEIDLL